MPYIKDEFVANAAQRDRIRAMFLPTGLLGVTRPATSAKGSPLVLPGNELLLDSGVNEDGSQWTRSIAVDDLIRTLDLESAVGALDDKFTIDDLIACDRTGSMGLKSWLESAKSKYGL